MKSEVDPNYNRTQCVLIRANEFNRLNMVKVRKIGIEKKDYCLWMKVALFGLRFYIPVNSYGHVKMVSSPYHNLFLGKLD